MSDIGETKSVGAICVDCHQNMRKADECTLDYVCIDNKRYNRIRYGRIASVSNWLWDQYKNLYNYFDENDNPTCDPDQRCHDCGVKLDKFHHLGCDMERCPKCGGQLIACGCWHDDGNDCVDIETDNVTE